MQRCLPLAFTLAVFSVYLLTTTPVVYLGDSGEFTAAAFSLGIPHNSGYPLYSLIGKIFCMIPMGNVGFRMNLMSAFFCSLTVLLIYHVILKATHSAVCAVSAAGYLAFTPLFWSQTVSAEVYPLHMFFVALIISLLWQWDQSRSFHHLLLLVFVTGVSFGNHMQTIMLAVPVLYFIISGDKKAIFTWRHFAAITFFFILPLTLYFYLPIRTQAGTAIHWGDPDNLERFLSHVTASAHRGSYVLSAHGSQYVERFTEALKLIAHQYGVLLLISIWGWVRLRSVRWKILLAGIIVFDLIYTVFLNIISFEITPFTLPSSVVLSILLGIGLNDMLGWVKKEKRVGLKVKGAFLTGLCAIPVIGLITNFSYCDQSRNYTAYEHAVNILRTTPSDSALFLDGDNNVFPVAYGRLVEGMGEGVALFDRHNVIFQWRLETSPIVFVGTWDEFQSDIIRRVIDAKVKQGVYFAVFNPSTLLVPEGYRTIPYGMLRKVVPKNPSPGDSKDIWRYYCEESFHDNFNRDYMNREVTSHYFFRKGEGLWLSGKRRTGMRFLTLASQIGYNDTSIHSDLGVFFTEQGLFEHARKELEKALNYYDDLSGIHNNWGYYHHKRGDYDKAIASFKEAIKLSPKNHSYYNNLGFTLFRAGRKGEAAAAFSKSLLIRDNQPQIRKFLQDKKLRLFS